MVKFKEHIHKNIIKQRVFEMNTIDTLQLWTQLSNMGNFSDSYYDKNICADLKKTLAITGNFEEGLQKISPEQVLQAFFQIISPLTSMYTDILNLYERCGADATNNNIEIEIDVNKLNHTRFNVTHFTHAKTCITRIKQSVQYVELSPEGMQLFWKLSRHAGVGWWDRDQWPVNASFRKWCDLYKSRLYYPSVQLDFESVIADLPIKESLHTVYIFWTELSNYYKSTVHEKPRNPNRWYPESDGVLGTALLTLYYIAENWQSFSFDKKTEIKTVLDEFKKFIKNTYQYIETALDEIGHFLSLPVWKHRHELYSVWVFIKMIEKIPNEYLTFNVQNNVLVFSYSGKQLASITINGIQMDIWTELRTNTIVKPIGKSRKKAIQPDYSIVYGCPSKAEDSIIVIECKQYKQPNTTNFKHAIIDYANNRPKAKVLLTDYGNFNSQKLITQLIIPKERYQLFTMCRPELESSTQLSSTVWELVCQHAGIDFTLEDTALFTLRWEKNPQDLDLHLLFKPKQPMETHQTCSYRDSMSGAEYSVDIREGYGPEEIRIHKWQKGIYELWVNNYSQTPPLTQSNATVTVLFTGTKKKTFTIDCPKKGDSQWWHLLNINTHNCTIKIINEIRTFTQQLNGHS